MDNIALGIGLWAYPGGGSVKAPTILHVAPPHTVYCEPFVGGGATFWMHPGIGIRRFVLGDLDKEVAKIWVALKDGSIFSILENAKCMPATEQLLLKLAAKQNRTIPETLTLWAQSRFGRNAKKWSSFGIFKDKLGVCLQFTKYKHYRQKIISKMSRTSFFMQDWRKTLQSCDSPSTFVMLDPPWEDRNTPVFYKSGPINTVDILKKLQHIRGKFLLQTSGVSGPYRDIAQAALSLHYNVYRVCGKTNSTSFGNCNVIFITNYKIPKRKLEEVCANEQQ